MFAQACENASDIKDHVMLHTYLLHVSGLYDSTLTIKCDLCKEDINNEHKMTTNFL